MTSTARTEPQVEPDGEFRRLAGRAISAIFARAVGLLAAGVPQESPIQGYFLGRPMPAPDVIGWLGAHRCLAPAAGLS
ncbi:hypothetical protein [Dactylosporangium sp. CA-139066]|uniref:hypothetical protein n=1 Tax=Dactylosporangium sp. CA-139066 TaxID=3239930 RepID=UPI003D904CF9